MRNLVPLDIEEVWRTRISQIPFLSFPEGWKVKIIPPFTGATIRFAVMNDAEDHTISVYCDFDDNLGVVGEPYWEMYPDLEGDTQRFMLNEIDELIAAIAVAKKGNKDV